MNNRRGPLAAKPLVIVNINTAFPFTIVLFEPESQSVLFHFTNLSVFFALHTRLTAGRLYLPTKNLSKQTIVVTGAAIGIGRAIALHLA